MSSTSRPPQARRCTRSCTAIFISVTAPVYRLEPFPASPKPVSRDQAARQPCTLLAAESQVVGFAGRAGELSELAQWRDEPAPGVSVMLVHGPGGQGKTRLAAKFAADSLAGGWTVWAAHHLSDPTGATAVAPGDSGQSLLVIVEYAERWPADDLQLLMQNPVLRRPSRSRVLLVTRPSGPMVARPAAPAAQGGY